MANEVGFRVTSTDHGRVQIDSGYSNMSMLKKGIESTSAIWSPTTNSRYVDVTVYSESLPVMAIHCGIRNFIFRTTKSGSNYTFRVVTEVPATFEYYVFTRNSRDMPGVGMRVRNPETGKVVYNSMLKYMRVLGYNVGNYREAGQPGMTETFYPGRKVACLQGKYCLEVQVAIFNDYEAFIIYGDGAQRNPTENSAILEWMDGGAEGPMDPRLMQVRDHFEYSYSNLFVDVTGY